MFTRHSKVVTKQLAKQASRITCLRCIIYFIKKSYSTKKGTVYMYKRNEQRSKLFKELLYKNGRKDQFNNLKA